MNIFLVDSENTGLKLDLPLIQSGDRILIFHSLYTSKDSQAVSELLETARLKGLIIEYLPVICGSKNALDFQLSSHLGYLIAKYDDKTNYIIVSNDLGYNAVIEYWSKVKPQLKIFLAKNQNRNIEQVTTNIIIKENPSVIPEQPPKNLTKKEIKKFRSDTKEKLQDIFKTDSAPLISLFESTPDFSTIKNKVNSKNKYSAYKDIFSVKENDIKQLYTYYKQVVGN